LRIPLTILFQVLLFLVLLTLWVLGTQTGLRFSLALVEEFAPGLLQVEQVDGRVLGDLHLAGLKVRATGLDLDLGGFDLRWRPLSVLTGILHISELTVRDLHVVAAPGEEEAEDEGPIELPQIRLPLQLNLEKALVERLSIGAPGDAPPFRVERIALAASWLGGDLTLKELSVALPEPLVNASARGKAELTGNYPLELGLSWDLSQEPALKLAGKAEIAGDLKRLQLTHDLTGSARVRLEALVLDVLDGPHWDGKLEILSVDLPSIAADLPVVDLNGHLTTRGNLNDARVQGDLVGEATDVPDFGRVKANLDVTWTEKVLDIVALKLTEDKSGALLTAHGQLDLNDPAGKLKLEAAWERLRWPLTGELVAEARQGRVDVGGTLEEYGYQASADVWGRDFPEASLQLQGEGNQESARIDGLRVDTLEGKIEADGRVTWAPELSWTLNLAADGINPGAHWSELPAQLELELASAGTLDAFEYGLEGALTSEVLPESTLRLNGEGNVNRAQARIETLRLETLGGYLAVKADLGWSPAVTWAAELDLADIDPGKQWPEWTGDLGGRFVSTGALAQDGLDLNALLESFKGTLRGYPVDAAARVRMKGKAVQIEQILLSSGSSKLKADGVIGDELDIRFALDSPDLRSLLPEASGSIKASGIASGPLATPAIKLELAARGVKVAGNGIQDFGGDANLDLGRDGLMKVDLSGKGLLAGGMRFDSLRVQGDGDMASHRLFAKVQGELLSLDLKAAGGLKAGNAYEGQLSGLELRTRDFSNWRLQKAAPVTLAGARIAAGPVCIREDAGSGGCVRFEQSEAGNWSAGLNLERLAFDLFKDFIPEGLVLEGEARAKADFRASGGVLTGNATLGVPKGMLSADRGGERLELLRFTSANLGVDAGAKGLQAKLAVPLTGLGDLSGNLSLPGWSLDDPARPSQTLAGGVHARVDDLGVVSRFVPDVTNLTGNLGADFKLSGAIAKPGISGSAALASGGLEVPFIGLRIEDLTFNAQARSLDRIEYSGGFKAGAGRLEIGGHSVLGGDGLSTRITAKGDKLKLADSKEYFVLAATDIQADITPTGSRVTGTVTVPEARIRPRSIPAGSVSPSSDVVVVAEGTVQDDSRYATAIDLRLILGKNVTVDAFGLEGKIEGELAVLQAPGKEMLGDGELKIVDGTYRVSTGGKWSAAIGKPLKIQQGFLNYAKSPIGNPFLVLTAQREGRSTTAGLRVFGTVKAPKMTFFSATDPGMSQSEVATYLTTGIPPTRSGETSEDRALSVGTYVTDKLFAEYDHSLGDESDKIKLRYDLNDWIELQTETGDSQGGDIFFKIER
jgi:translocation and assembly module TamB